MNAPTVAISPLLLVRLDWAAALDLAAGRRGPQHKQMQVFRRDPGLAVHVLLLQQQPHVQGAAVAGQPGQHVMPHCWHAAAEVTLERHPVLHAGSWAAQQLTSGCCSAAALQVGPHGMGASHQHRRRPLLQVCRHHQRCPGAACILL